MKNSRIEKDSMGKIYVSSNHLWGAQTQRSLKYFNISNEKMPYDIILALAQIKLVAAKVNKDLGFLEIKTAESIMQASNEILSGKYKNEFPLVIWQTGSGTQTNMNINEVIANIASKLLGGEYGEKRLVHPNDHVNKNQSSNDVFPTAMHIAAVISILKNLIPSISKLYKTLLNKSILFKNIIKIGRTHLQDAIPITLGQEISSWATMLFNSIKHIKQNINYLSQIALGGTAVGTGFDIHPEYPYRVAEELSKNTGYTFTTSINKFESISTCDAIVYAHGSLKGLAASIMKIANDIRWLSSGPRCGIGEITIPENEPGSSIMPGKVNPTQCEALTMICCQVIGNDVSINIGGSSGNFQLNVYRPMIIYNFLQSVRLLSDSINSFNHYCVKGIKPNKFRINELLNKSLMLVTSLNKYIGYDKSAKIAQKAHIESISLKESAIKLGYITEKEFEKWINPKKMISNIKI